MKCIFEINGWKKEIDVPSEFVKIKSYEVSFSPPVNASAEFEKPVKYFGTVVRFIFAGRDESGRVIFRA